MTPIFPDCGGCVTGGFFLRCAWLRFWQQATHAILSRFALRIHVLSGVVGGLTPCFLTVVKMSILCKNGDLKMPILRKTKLLKLSVLCILCLECYDSQYICAMIGDFNAETKDNAAAH